MGGEGGEVVKSLQMSDFRGEGGKVISRDRGGWKRGGG